VLGTRSVHMAMRRGPALWNIRYGLPEKQKNGMWHAFEESVTMLTDTL
jgi:hypothetical protein